MVDYNNVSDVDQFVQTSAKLYFSNVTKSSELARGTGTSIVACLTKDGIVLGSDLQASVVQTFQKFQIEHKLYKILNERYVIGLAGVAQLITPLIRAIVHFEAWYQDIFQRPPSFNNIIDYLRNTHAHEQWNYYAHIIIGGMCPREKVYKLAGLSSGDRNDITSLDEPYLIIGSGTKYLTGAMGFLNGTMELATVKQTIVTALKVATTHDLGSGKDLEIFTMCNQQINIERIKLNL